MKERRFSRASPAECKALFHRFPLIPPLGPITLHTFGDRPPTRGGYNSTALSAARCGPRRARLRRVAPFPSSGNLG